MNYIEIFLNEFLKMFVEMAPFLLLGFFLAGVIHVWLPQKYYIPKISQPNFKSSFLASLFGVPLPICSCGVIPTAIALRKEGASRGASVSFLISTPATGVDSIFATYSLLGLPFAILRPIAAFVTSLFGGVLTNIFTRNQSENSPKEIEKALPEHDHCSCGGHCENEKKEPQTFAEKIKKTFSYGLVEMVGEITKWLLIGLLLGALISAFIPNDFFAMLREYPLLCMLLVLLLSMPMYTCATGSIPLALALVSKGITPGAALVLLMAGPATSIASMLVVGKAFGKRTLIAYLISIAGGALFFGFLIDTFCMDLFLNGMNFSNTAHAHSGHSIGIFEGTMALILAILIINAQVRKKFAKHNHKETTMAKIYKVKGMNCNHCKMCVEKAVKALPGIVNAEADVSKSTLTIEGDAPENEIQKAVEEAGFEFKGIA